MEFIDSVRKHIKDISCYQNNKDFTKEIDKFISENKGLNESELLDRMYEVYGTRIKFFEEATRCKYMKSIKEWVATFGFFLVVGIIIWIIVFAMASVEHPM